MNPFRYGSVVSGKDFCGREGLIEHLLQLIEAGQNVVLQGERRVGKTSLFFETIRRCKGKRPLFLDLMEVKSSDDLCKKILHAVIALEKKGNLFERILKNLAYLRPGFSLDPITALPTLTFDASVKLSADSIPEIISLVENLHKEKPLVVIFDEFQDVLNIKNARPVIAQLRSQIQYHSEIPYIFAGSIRNKMDEIFTHPDSPFYKSAIPLAVEPLAYGEFAPFLKRRFKQGGRKVEDIVLARVFEIAENVPGDIQQFCEALWTVTTRGETITKEKINEAIRLIFTREQKSYEIILSDLTGNQMKVLFALAMLGGTKTASSEFLRMAGSTNASSVRQALEKMVKRKILYWTDKECRFANPFFRAWVLHRNALTA
jgi:hypothetical protein